MDLGPQIVSVVRLGKKGAPGIEIVKSGIKSVGKDAGLVQDGNRGTMVVTELLNASPAKICGTDIGDHRVWRVQPKDLDGMIEGCGRFDLNACRNQPTYQLYEDSTTVEDENSQPICLPWCSSREKISARSVPKRFGTQGAAERPLV